MVLNQVFLTNHQEAVFEFVSGLWNSVAKNSKKRISISVQFHNKDTIEALEILYGNKCLVFHLWEKGIFLENLPEILLGFFSNSDVEINYRAGDENGGDLDPIQSLGRFYQRLAFASIKRVTQPM